MRIGPHQLSNPYLLAPMAGLASTPFRGICIEHGAAAAPTELISATAIAHRNSRTLAMIERAPHEPLFWVQLFGADPGVMARAAERAVERGAMVIDINMGCPVRKVTNAGSGSALMQDTPRAVRIVEEIRAAVGEQVPVTVKFRSGWEHDQRNYLDFGQALEQAGAAALCLHPRTRAQRYSGQADWSLITALRQQVTLPLIGNGDVGCVADGRRMLVETGCDAVMVGRAALGNPWIFTGLVEGREVDPTPAQRTAVVIDHLDRLIAQVDEPIRALQRFRSRILYYTRGLDGGVEFRRNVVRIDDADELREAIRSYFCDAGRARGYRPGRAAELLDPSVRGRDSVEL